MLHCCYEGQTGRPAPREHGKSALESDHRRSHRKNIPRSWFQGALMGRRRHVSPSNNPHGSESWVKKFWAFPASGEMSPLSDKDRLGLNPPIARFLLCESGAVGKPLALHQSATLTVLERNHEYSGLGPKKPNYCGVDWVYHHRLLQHTGHALHEREHFSSIN